MACLKLKADIDCIFYLDGEERSHLRAGIIQKIPLAKGEYELLFVSEDHKDDSLELEFEMPDVDKLQKVNLGEIRDFRLHKEAEIQKIAEEKRLAEEKKRKEEIEARERKLPEENRKAEEKKLAEERKREKELKAEEERKHHEEEKLAKEMTVNVGGVPFKMIRVEGGSMGTFYIGETQVTQKLWQAVMGDNPAKFKGQDHPVEFVSWNDICGNDGSGTDPNCFLYKLNKETGKKFRLPKESEWEYAAKGGNKSKNYTYAGSDNIDEVAWYWKNSGNKYLEGSDDDWNWDTVKKNNAKTHPVKQLIPNELGIYDMSGNVWEWCQDLYAPKGSDRVLRGGSWCSNTGSCRVANRYSYSPGSHGDIGGFRLALVQ